MLSVQRLRSVLFICFLALCVFRLCSLPPSAEQQLAAYMGRQAVVLGDVEPLSVRENNGYTSAVVRCRELQVAAGMSDGRATAEEAASAAAEQNEEAVSIVERADVSACAVPYAGRLRVSVEGQLPLAGSVVISGTLERLTSLRNPGGFDAENYNRVQELGGRLTQARLVAEQGAALWWQRFALWNLRLSQRIEKAVGEKYGALLSGMLLGGRSRLDEETRELFTTNGLAHLLSVSGTHIVLLTGVLLALLRPVPLAYRKLVILLLLTCYAALCGLRPPVLRALSMSSVLLLGGRGAERGRLLVLVALALLCYQPLWFMDIGFQLSFAAAAGLLWLLGACRRLVPECVPACLGDALSVTLSAQLAVLPLEIYYFYQFSLISLISNLVLVPILELAAQLALAGALLPVLGDYLLQAAGWLVAQMLTQAELFADLPYSTVVIGEVPAYCAVLYYALLAVWADFPWLQFLSNVERRGVLLLCGVMLSGTLCYMQLRTLPLACYFLDVGQGDCAAIVTPARHIAVIDTGGLKNLSTASRVIAPFLRTLGKREVDLLLLSHYDFDHVGAAAALLRQVRVKELILPNEALTPESERVQREILTQAQKSGTQVRVAVQGAQFALDEGVALTLVDVPTEALSGNEASTLAALVSGRGSVLFTGDMGEARERSVSLAQHYDVLKAGHHGSRYSSSADFLAQVAPKMTVVSCGAGNRYGHPHEETLERLAAAKSTVARTDELGCVKVVFDERGSLECYSYGNWHWQRLPKYNL